MTYRWKRRLARLWALPIALAVTPASASLSDCKGLYVARVQFTMADPRPQVRFAETPIGAAATTWVYPTTGLTERAYQQLYATLLTAKTSGRAVTITTDGPNQCDLTGANYLTAIELE